MTAENISMNFQYGTESLNYYFKQNKLTQTQYTAVQEAMKNIYNVINTSVKNYNSLHNASKILKKDLNTAKYELQAASNRQSEASEAAEALSRSLKTAQVAYQSQKTSYDNLVFEMEELEKEILNQELKIKQQKKEAEERMQPKRDRYLLDISNTKFSNDKAKTQIQSIQKLLQENMQKINALRSKNQEADADEKKLIELKLKIIDSPQHYFKSSENLHIEVLGMEAELKEMRQQIERKEKVCINNDQKRKNQVDQQQELQKQRQAEIEFCEGIDTQIEKLKHINYSLEKQRDNEKVDMMNVEHEFESRSKQLKSEQQRINTLLKEVERNKKLYKKFEIQKKQHQDQILEYVMMIEKIQKEESDIHLQMREQKSKAEDIQKDLIVIQKRITDAKDQVIESDVEKKGIQNQIAKLEKNLTELKKTVATIQKQVKDLTAVRQSMARKASSAMSEVRQTRQQLKVKQLLILDLTKKYQETQNKLQHFKALYEQVKSARNKYVNLIQNSSQDLAELKQRIKILQNQLEILKNESTQKNRTIQDYNHMLQLQKHKRDQMKAKLNKYEFEKKEKKELVDQNINQIEKLNMIILSLQKDMQKLRSNYQEVCQNRNYTGIQLIDRNDQLCILYEKSNIQENILRKAEFSVKSLQDEIRMIYIEIAETERKIKVSRDKILHVPKLAEKVIQLQELLQSQHKIEIELSNQLENPNNQARWRELHGEDPDEEALDAKIAVLQERLNSKKQQLLEKQLVLDEVTNLTEKLRKQAVDGRQSTLQVSEKINEFQSRLKDLTRKMKATISQLSMCQANAIKYQQQRQSLQQLVENAKKRMEQGLPPTPETQIQYLKMIRDKKRYEQQKQIRQQKQMIQQSYPPFATKTTAEHRVNAYIPDQIGLPKPYGKNAPFKPSEPGANMRHIRKPKIKEIEI